MPNIAIITIPHKEQRYETVGDWQYDVQNNLEIHVSDTHDVNLNFLIGLHELIEAHLCKQSYITQEEVDAWDKAHDGDIEPGAIRNCPYYRQHLLATVVERMIAGELDVDWDEYEKALEEL